MPISVISNDVSTHSNKIETKQPHTSERDFARTKQPYIYVAQLHDGRIVIGQHTNAAKRIAALNSGHNPAVPKALQINRLIGVKPVTETRTLMTVVKQFCDNHGVDKVICV